MEWKDLKHFTAERIKKTLDRIDERLLELEIDGRQEHYDSLQN